jgi:hypothetical protein
MPPVAAHSWLPSNLLAKGRLNLDSRAEILLRSIVLLGILLRVGSALYQGNSVEPLPGVHDQISYDNLARRVLGGYGFTHDKGWWPATRAGEPTAHWSYAYTLYLVLVYSLFGPNPLAARLLQSVVAGIFQPWFSYRLGCRLFGRKAGVLAALISSIYAYFVFYAGALMTETFCILAILWALDTATAPVAVDSSRPGRIAWYYWLSLGMSVGLAVLMRQVFLAFVPFLFAWLWQKDNARAEWPRLNRPRLLGLLISTAVVAAMILPCTLRNYLAFRRFVLLNTNMGFALFWGNHPIHGSEFVPILPADGPSYHDLIPPSLLGMDEAALDRALLLEGFRLVAEKPGRFLRLSLGRTKEYFKFWPSPQSGAASNAARVLSFGLLAPLSVLGLYLAIRRSFGWGPPMIEQPDIIRADARRGTVLLLLFIAVYSLIHLLSWGLIRYRLPVDAVLVLFASVGLLCVAERIAKAAGSRIRNEATQQV